MCVGACVCVCVCVCVGGGGGGGYSHFFLPYRLGPSIYCLPKINQVYQAYPYKILEILAYPLKYPHSVL